MTGSGRVQNKDILERIEVLEALSNERISQLEARLNRNDTLLRGRNGDIGIKARVDANTKALERINKYFQALITGVSITILIQIIELIGG